MRTCVLALVARTVSRTGVPATRPDPPTAGAVRETIRIIRGWVWTVVQVAPEGFSRTYVPRRARTASRFAKSGAGMAASAAFGLALPLGGSARDSAASAGRWASLAESESVGVWSLTT